MTDKPRDAAGYSPESAQDARAACLYMATILGDLLMEDMVVVGGLVPSLLIEQDPPDEGVPLHPGTMDLDLGLSLGVLDEARYSEIAKRLREAGFAVSENQEGKKVLQTWTIRGENGRRVTVDFLIAPSSEEDEPSKIRHLEADLGAVITPGLDLAFEDRVRISINGATILGERAHREVPVCGPGAFVVLKALAFGIRGTRKDAYDLYYTVRNYAAGVEEIAQRIHAVSARPETQRALSILRENFTEADHTGPARAAGFSGETDENFIRQDVVGFILRLLDEIDGLG